MTSPRFSTRSLVLTAALAFTLTIAAGHVPRTVTATYPDIMGCERGCEVAAAGFPLPFIVDYPGLSPVGSAHPAGALLGLDRVLWPRAVAVLVFWSVVSVLLATIVTRSFSRKRTAT